MLMSENAMSSSNSNNSTDSSSSSGNSIDSNSSSSSDSDSNSSSSYSDSVTNITANDISTTTSNNDSDSTSISMKIDNVVDESHDETKGDGNDNNDSNTNSNNGSNTTSNNNSNTISNNDSSNNNDSINSDSNDSNDVIKLIDNSQYNKGGFWRVKLYNLSTEGQWHDKGTGNVTCSINTNGDSLLVVHHESDGTTILQSKIQTGDVYERQGETIIMWRELIIDNSNSNSNNSSSSSSEEIDYALSFQEVEGCHSIWDAISDIQSQFIMQSRICDQIPYFSSSSSSSSSSSISDNIWGQQQDNHHHHHHSMSSNNISLPIVNIDNIQLIKERLSTVPYSHKDAYATLIIDNNGQFIRDLLHISNDIINGNSNGNGNGSGNGSGNDDDHRDGGHGDGNDGNRVTLGKISDIFRLILYFNNTRILEYVLDDRDVFISIAG